MDIHLPGLDGFGALKFLLTDPRTKDIPVIALSANAVPRDIDKGLQAGFFRYLIKPIKVPEFMTAIDSALMSVTRKKVSNAPAILVDPVVSVE